MKIAVVGAGHAGCTVSADLSLRGHEVTLIKTTQAMHNKNFQHLVANEGRIQLVEGDAINETRIAHISKNLNDVENNDIVIIYIQSNYHEELVKKLKGLLQPEQILLFNPGYLSTAYVLKHFDSPLPAVVEAQSSFIDCRIMEPGMVKVGFRNVRNPVGIFYPGKDHMSIKNKLDEMGFPLTYLDSVVEAALHNPNLIVHTVGAVMSIPRIEKTGGEYCMYHEVFTPSVWNILEQLDKEKLNVLESMGFEQLSYVEACKYRNSLDDTRDAKEIFFWYASMPTRAKGPQTVDSRYITEDVSEGLVMLEAFGIHLGVATPITTSLIEIASSALGSDLRRNGRSLKRLGIENLQKILRDNLIENKQVADEHTRSFIV